MDIDAFQIQKFAANFAIGNICIFTEPKLKQICIFNFAAILGAENLNTKFTEKNRKINVFQKSDVSCVKIESKQTQHCVIRVGGTGHSPKIGPVSAYTLLTDRSV